MNWRLGRLWGTELQVNISALIIVGFLVLPGFQRGDWVRPTLFAVVLVLSILVHELGHAVVANLHGLGPCRILIHGFGGLCSFTTAPRHAQGFRVSLAGPAAGLALGALAYGLGQFFEGQLPPWALLALELTIHINLFWSLFNLLPMYPLDGGQALRHFLYLWWSPERAERTTRRLGMFLGLLVGALGIWQQSLFMGFIGLMVIGQNRKPRPVNA